MPAQSSTPQAPKADLPPASRRGFFFGAAATGAAVAAVGVLPGGTVPEAQVEALRPAPEKGGGYSLSAHVQRYYKTARV